MDITNKLVAGLACVLLSFLHAFAFEYNDGKVTWSYFPVEGAADEVCLGDGTNACVAPSVGGAITLPDTIDGKRVTRVAANAFKGCTKVTGVSILGNLEWVEEGAFDGATSLKSFGTLNRNENFFSYQGSLYMGDWESAELVRVPPALEADEFTGLVKPQVRYVYHGAFNGCAAVKKIQVSYDSAEALYECSFVGCAAFTEFVWAGEYWDDWSEYLVKDGVLYCGDCELVKWPTAKPLESFESMVLSENSDFCVADGAFAGNPMEKITIPAWVGVGSYAFAGCVNLREIAFLGYDDCSCDVLYDLEDAGINLKKVVYPGFPKGMAERWEGLFDDLKECGGIYSRIVYEKTADPNLGKTNITIPYTERGDLCCKYDFESYAKDLTTLTFEGPCPDVFFDILCVCSNVTKVVYSANPLYRDYDYDWTSWKEVKSWDWTCEFPDRAITFEEGEIPSEPQFYFEDPECRDCLCGICCHDEAQGFDVYLSPIWPSPVGELNIPDGVYELGEGALFGLDQVTKLILPHSLTWDGSIDEYAGFETMTQLAEIEGGFLSCCSESSKYYSQSGCLYCDWQLFRVPPAYRADQFTLNDYPCNQNALVGCRNITSLTAGSIDALECILSELDLTGCDRLSSFVCKAGHKSGYSVVSGSICEDCDGRAGELRLLLWPNGRRPIRINPKIKSVDCDAFRYLAHPEEITELTMPRTCEEFDLHALAETYGVSNITKIVCPAYPDCLSADLLEVMPGLSEIVFNPNPFYAPEWNKTREEFKGTGVRFTAEEPDEPLYGYELDVWEEDDYGNILDGECYLGYEGYPFVYPALKGAYAIPEKIENCRVVWAYENAFANMDELTELTFPQGFYGFDESGSYREGYWEGGVKGEGEFVVTGEVDIVYSPFVGCTSLVKLTFNGTCPDGLWEVLEVTPSIKEVYYNDFPWTGICGETWSEFIAEFQAEHPDSQVVFTPLEHPVEPLWNVDAYGGLDGEYDPEEGIRIPCVWPDLVGEATVPSDVRSIGENAFACMSNLTALTIPASVEEVADAAFAGCTSLVKLTFNGACPDGLWEVLEVTPSVLEVYYNDSPWCGESGWIWREFIAEFQSQYPESGVTFIALPAPEEPVWLVEDGELCGEYDPEEGIRIPCVWPDLVGEATVPSDVRSIGENAFACMSSLTALTIPASVEEVADAAFAGCTSLKKLVFQGGIPPDGAMELLELTPSIEEVVVPSWKFLGGACEEGVCNEWLEWFVYEYKSEHPDSIVVFKKDDGTVIVGREDHVPWKIEGDTMTVDWGADIDGDAFDGVDLFAVTRLVLPPYLVYVEDGVFGALTNLREVEMGVALGVDDMSPCLGAFGEGQRLKLTLKPEIWWECDCESCEDGDGRCPVCAHAADEDWLDCDDACDETCGCLGHWETEEFAIRGEMFSGCEWIEALEINEPAFAIRDRAFSGCVNLKSVTIPASVEWIGESVFAGCASLDAVYFDGNAPYGCLWLYDGASSGLVSYVKSGTTGWSGVDGDVGMPADGLWPVWDEGDETARPVKYGTKYVIVFDANGGAGAMVDQTCARDKVYNLAKCAFTAPTGKAFAGWACKETGKRYDDGILIFNAAEEGKTLTLTAIWE